MFDLSDQIVLVSRFATIGLCSDKMSLCCSLIEIKAADFKASAFEFFLSYDGKTVVPFFRTTFLSVVFFPSSCSLLAISRL